jgi:hypothetical protein
MDDELKFKRTWRIVNTITMFDGLKEKFEKLRGRSLENCHSITLSKTQ